MIRYFAYYSVGGYKDFFLGDNLSKHEYTYYLPLLPAYRKRAEQNPEYSKKVAELEKLPQIGLLSNDDSKGFPKQGEAMIAHSGYELIYRHIEDDTVAICCRDIASLDKDDVGRPIPFVFCLICDNREEWSQMDNIALYWAEHLAEAKKILANMLHLDSETSGLRFSIDDFNKWILGLPHHSVPLMDAQKAFVLRPLDADLRETIRLQELQKLNVSDFPSSSINDDVHLTLSENEHRRLLEKAVEKARDEITNEMEQQKRKHFLVSMTIGFVLGFLLALLFSTCGHK